MMQNALLQDAALVPGTTDRASVNTRILKVDLASGQTASTCMCSTPSTAARA